MPGVAAGPAVLSGGTGSVRPRYRDSGREPPRESAPAFEPLPGAPRLVLGIQPVRAAIRAQRERLGAVLLESEAPRLEAIGRFARDQGVTRVEVVGRATLDRLSAGIQHQGVAAFAPALELSPFEALLANPELVGLALDRIQDPQNFGAVIRSLVGLGGTGIVWGEHSSAPLGPATQRAAAGALEFATLCRVPSLPGALTRAVEAGVTVIGLDAAAERSLRSFELTRPVLLVIGSEHSGMTPGVRRACTHLARLYAPGPVESLNASVAAALALYEIVSRKG
jgi:23S rRNA (guanosine2251-2'-O)-methyltransferase